MQHQQAELARPRPLDTLIIDGMLFALTYQYGQLGYIHDKAFIPVDPNRLKKADRERAGRPTWIIVGTDADPGPHATGESTSVPVMDTDEKSFIVGMTYNGREVPSRVITAKDEKVARNKAIREFATANKLLFSTVFDYFNTNPTSILVEEL